MTVTLLQDGNTLGTTEDTEELKIDLEYQTPEPGKGAECFYTLRTEGWSMEGLEEIATLANELRVAAQKLSEGGE